MKLTNNNSKKELSKDKDRFKNGDHIIDNRGEILVVYGVTKKKFKTKYLSDGSNYSTHEFDAPTYSDYIKLTKPIDEYKKDLIKFIEKDGQDEIVYSDSTDLITQNNDQLVLLQQQIEEKQKALEVVYRLMEDKKSALRTIMSNMNDQVDKIKKVVGIIELYLGIGEEIICIKEGDKASIDTPICFRQLVIHMDEESIFYTDKEIDFTNIDVFDDYVVKRFESIIPEKKGVVVCRPRRYEKRYSDNALENARLNDKNFTTYILIRNGETLYRIKSCIEIYPFLFPEKNQKDTDSHGWRISDKDKEETQTMYKRNALMLQGLIDRTEVFHPFPTGISIMNPDTYDNKILFIHDGSDIIHDGKISYKEWLKKINSTLERGSRFFFCGFDYGEDRSYRMAEVGGFGYGNRDNEVPNSQNPDAGVYNIDRVEPSERYGERLVFKHNPKDTIYPQDIWKSSYERTKALTYYVYKDDEIILNYDKIDIKDIDYYMTDRVNRQWYKDMLPVLKGIKAALLKEKKEELAFIELIKSKTGKSDEEVIKAIEWWKYKVIEKRPLIREDAKAVRMIIGRLKGKK